MGENSPAQLIYQVIAIVKLRTFRNGGFANGFSVCNALLLY